MDEVEGWLQSATGNAAGVGAASAVALLSVKLARRGLLNDTDVAELRLAGLMMFDSLQDKFPDMTDNQKHKLENVRASIDGLWQQAAKAAEG